MTGETGVTIKTIETVDQELSAVQQKLNDMFAQQQRLIGYRIRILEEQQETEETKVEEDA
tara:strand:- start:997 stop:1176 length:180 start_codon:yes stop_codon:yes gene_type:complete